MYDLAYKYSKKKADIIEFEMNKQIITVKIENVYC